jgi:hypothetical protein
MKRMKRMDSIGDPDDKANHRDSGIHRHSPAARKAGHAGTATNEKADRTALLQNRDAICSFM